MFNIKTRTTQLLAAVGLIALSSLAQAGMVFSVENTSVTNCSGAPHGLWTGSSFNSSGTCGNFFSIESGIFTVNDNGTGSLVAKANNPQSLMADINLTFSGFYDTLPTGFKYKKEGGANYNPVTDDPNVDFFTQIGGTIEIGNDKFYINHIVKDFAFQFGLGANAKKADEFGASAWIVPDSYSDNQHWDLNLKLTKVPEPGTLAMLLAGLLSLVVIRRRLA